MATEPVQFGYLPQWLQLFLAATVGLVTGVVAVVRAAWSFNTRLQRIEHQDLDQIIDARIEAWSDRRALVRQEQIDARLAVERHDNLYPMLQVRVFSPIDKMEDELKMQGQNIAVLLERDRTSQALEKIAAALAQRPPAA